MTCLCVLSKQGRKILRTSHPLDRGGAPTASSLSSTDSLSRTITYSELRRALKKCNLDSAPGADQLSYRILTLMHSSALRVLLALFNLCLSSGVVPEAWCTAVVRPLFKGDALNDPFGPLDVDNYRGISLTSCVGKLLEKIVAIRIEKHVAEHSPLCDTQNGFRRKRSALTQVWNLTETLAARGPNSLVIFFDLKKAFPSVRRSSLLSSLYARGIRGPLWHLVAAYYDNTKGAIRIGEYLDTVTYPVSNGVKEGSLLSPLLFVLFIDELLWKVKEAGLGYSLEGYGGRPVWAGMFGYADDLAAVPRSVEDAQRLLDVCGDFALSHVCRFSHEKTVVMLMRPAPDLASYPGVIRLSLRRKADRTSSWIRPLMVVSSYKYLGVLLHHSGSLSQHVKKVVRPAVEAKLAALRATVLNRETLTPKLSLQVLDVDVLSIIRYSCALWESPPGCVWGDDQLEEELEQLDAIMVEVTNHLMDVPVVRFHSQGLLNADVGWLGLQFHYMKASLGLLKELAGLPWGRLSKHLLWRRLLQMHDHEQYEEVAPSYAMQSVARMLHLENPPSIGQQDAWALVYGPSRPLTPSHGIRLDRVVGMRPWAAASVEVPTTMQGGVEGRYVWRHLLYDLENGHLVIPAGEATRSRTLSAGRLELDDRSIAHTFGPGYDRYVMDNYAYICRDWPAAQQAPMSTPWVAGVVYAMRQEGGIASLREATRATDPRTLTRARNRIRQRALACLRYPHDPSPRWSLHAMHYVPGWSIPENGPGEGLATATHSAYGEADVGVISKARAGVYALGYVVDTVYPPEHFPFCPCCRMCVSETWAHHLLGRCTTTQALAQSSLPRLIALMAVDVPAWPAQFTSLALQPEMQAAMILCAADEQWLLRTTRMAVAQLVAQWLQDVLEKHPMCSRQLQPYGKADPCMRYQGYPYDSFPWTEEQDRQLIALSSAEEAIACFPAKYGGAVRRRYRRLRSNQERDLSS